MKPSNKLSKNWFGGLLAVLLSLLSFSAVEGQITVGVHPFSPSGGVGIGFYTSVGDFGNISILGETVAVPSNSTGVLNSFSAYEYTPGGVTAGLNAYVEQWSTTTNTPVGGVLWSSSAPVIIPGSSDQVPVLVTFNTGNLQLNPADEYLLAFTGADYYEGVYDDAGLLAFDVNTYNGGQEVYAVAGTWFLGEAYDGGSVLDFSASFQAVPEPSTYALMIGGLAFLAFCVRRKGSLVK